MNQALPDAAQRIETVLAGHGLAGRVRVMPASTRTATEAAAAIGCAVAQIAKSLVFRVRGTDLAVLAIASGVNRVDEKKLAAAVGAKIERADADFVRAATGFAIGGVPPVAHAHSVAVFIDRDLLKLDELWAAAGTPHAVFRLTGDELCRITAGTVIDMGAAS